MGTEEPHQEELAQHMLAHLLCNERRTVTGLLNTLGRQHQDWSKAYRLYREHVDSAAVFTPILEGVLELIPEASALVIAVDDSHLRKTGKQVHAAGWYRDPLGPAFHTNLMYAHRFIQLSAAVPDPANPKRSRMIPIAVELIPKLSKPGKHASPADWDYYEKIKALNSPGAHARRLLQRVREHLDASGQNKERIIQVCGDGDYSNSTLLPHLPPRTIYIGRTRSDINLHSVPKQPQRRSAGRPRSYGKPLPTPEELRKDRSVSWKQLTICNGPKTTKVRYKHISQAKWQVAGEKAVVQVVVIAPLRYRKRKNGPWRYTKPAYLVCTDADMPVDDDPDLLLEMGHRGQLQRRKATLRRGTGPGPQRIERLIGPSGLHRNLRRVASRRHTSLRVPFQTAIAQPAKVVHAQNTRARHFFGSHPAAPPGAHALSGR